MNIDDLGQGQGQGQTQQGFDPSSLMAPAPGEGKKNGSGGAKAPIIKLPKQSFSSREKEKPRLSLEEVKECQKLVLHISRYLNHPEFCECLEELGLKPGKGKGQPPLQDLDKQELEELLERIKLSVRNVGGGGLLNTMVMGGVGFAENFSQRPGIVERCDLKGWSGQLQGDAMFKRALAEMEIEYNMVSNLSPEMRLTMALGNSALMVSQINAFQRRMAAASASMQQQQSDEQGIPPLVTEESKGPVFQFEIPPDPPRVAIPEAPPVPEVAEVPEGKRGPGRPRKRDHDQLLESAASKNEPAPKKPRLTKTRELEGPSVEK